MLSLDVHLFIFSATFCSQACSQEDRKRDFEKIFAHYDVVSGILPTLIIISFSLGLNSFVVLLIVQPESRTGSCKAHFSCSFKNVNRERKPLKF